jgi:linoleoyl-CoA desaturase
VINFVYACFNHHVAHHLFPDVSRIHYPLITKEIARFAREYNLPYKRYGLVYAIRSHFIMLKGNAEHTNFFEETL